MVYCIKRSVDDNESRKASYPKTEDIKTDKERAKIQ